VSVSSAGAKAGEIVDEPASWEPSRAFLKASIAFLLVSTGIFEALLFALGQGYSMRSVMVFALATVAAPAWIFMRGSQVKAGLLTLGAGVWSYLTFSAVFMGGINSVSMICYPMPVLLAGWLRGSRAAMQLAFATVLVGLGLLVAEVAGRLPQAPPSPAVMRWFIQGVVLVFLAFLVSHVFRSYSDRLADVRRLGAALAERTAELEAREADLNRAQAVAGIGSWVYDIVADCMRLSAETCRIFGQPSGTCGSHDAYLSSVHRADRAALEAAWRAALTGGAAFDHEHRIVCGGTIRWVRQKAELQRDAAGNVLRAVGTTQDITERKLVEAEMRAARNQLAATLDAIPDLLFEVGLDGRYHAYHSPHAELLAAPPDQLMGRTVAEILPPDAAGVALAALREANEKGTSHGMSFELPLPQGRFWFELSVAKKPVAAGEEPRFIVISRDISERKRAELEVLRFNATLEERVRERTAELEKANRELESFSYTVSHDLRSPLRGMVGFAGLLSENLQGKLDEENRTYLQRIAASGNRMSRLIDGVLEYSRLARSEIARCSVDLDQVVRDVVDEMRDRYPRAEIIANQLGRAEADPVMVRQIFHNLIGNALKFSANVASPRVEIGVQAAVARTAGAGVEYFVRDNGVGFDMKHADHLFNLFTRLHRDADYESTGAGLAIVKRLVERHNGTIRAEAAAGLGATFRFSLGA
jgi:PAS domain S-box-containing protein